MRARCAPNEKRTAFGDRMSSRRDSAMEEGAHVPVERVLAAAGYTEQTSLHFGADGYHGVSYQSTRLEKFGAEVEGDRYPCCSCC